MADIADRAATEYAVYEEARAAARLSKPAPVHAEFCDHCGVPIPLERRRALVGHECLTCVDCQGLLERTGGGR